MDVNMELSLVSGTERIIDGISPGIHVKLSQYRSLPQPSLASPWKRSRLVCSLKDRLIMEWVFCQRDSMKVLHEIVTLIDNKISSSSSRRYSKSLQSLIVGISCCNGICQSPCFVEKLYDHYYSFPPFEGLKITRTHTALPLPSAHGYQWQQLPSVSKFSRHKKSFQNTQQLKVLTASNGWSPLPPLLNTQIEESFNKDPLDTKLMIGDVHIDFVEGSLYSKTTGQKSYIRCLSEPPQVSVTVRDLTDTSSYQLSIKGFEAAGILPYSVHPKTGEAIFLVGQLTYDGGSWSDFGGLKSKFRFKNETPSQTAARECFEETLGVLGTSEELLGSLRSYAENNTFKVVNETCRYVDHFLHIHYDHYPARFAVEAMKKLVDDEELEVNAMRWIPLGAVREAVRITLAGGSHSIEVYAINESDGSYDSSLLHLRWEFAQTLCIADKLGVLNSIEYITNQQSLRERRPLGKELRTKEHDSPQDLVSPMTGISLEEERIGEEGATGYSHANNSHSHKGAKGSETYQNRTRPRSSVGVKLYGMGAGTFHRIST